MCPIHLTIVEEKLYTCPKNCNCDANCTCNDNCTCCANYLTTYKHKWVDAMNKFSKSRQKFDPDVPVTWVRINKNGFMSLSDIIDFIYNRITKYLPKYRLYVDDSPFNKSGGYIVRRIAGHIYDSAEKNTDYITEKFYQIYSNCYCLLDCNCECDYIGEYRYPWNFM